MATTTFKDLPFEVQEQVGRFLTQRDLSACVRVCQAWRTLFHAQLWRHITIDWVRIRGKSSASYVLKTNAHLVQSIKLKCDIDKFPQFLESFPGTFSSRLTSAEIHGCCSTGDQAFIDFIRRGSRTGWKKLAFVLDLGNGCMATFGTHLLEAIIENAASTIEDLRFEWDRRFESSDIDRVLCSAPNLKELWITSKRPTRRTSMMHAQEILDSEWVCNDLEVLSCRIGGVPRPDITRNICGNPPSIFTPHGSRQESIDLQHQVYSKLARLTKLRVLWLGWPLDVVVHDRRTQGKEFFRQYDCLAMTVESGLDLLKGLKDLRVVGLEDMEVYVDGDEEKTWFAENWPHAVIKTTDYKYRSS